MCRYQPNARNSVQLQERMFRLAEARHGLSIPVLATETGIPKETLRGWKAGTTMPAWSLFALARSADGGKPLIPEYLLSLVASPYQMHVAADHLEESALHDAVTAASEVTTEFLTATSPDSDGGPAITPREDSRIREKALKAGGKLRAVGGRELRAANAA
jgi:hypothetical protein